MVAEYERRATIGRYGGAHHYHRWPIAGVDFQLTSWQVDPIILFLLFQLLNLEWLLIGEYQIP